MNTETQASASSATWFVGAVYDGTDDQSSRFLSVDRPEFHRHSLDRLAHPDAQGFAFG